ncbi:hypothetical protein BC826DRAFT_1177232 [Russula brevipes]|nr:hypothetical protein BC826DRAFT_1177232 [Russula brevipes]
MGLKATLATNFLLFIATLALVAAAPGGPSGSQQSPNPSHRELLDYPPAVRQRDGVEVIIQTVAVKYPTWVCDFYLVQGDHEDYITSYVLDSEKTQLTHISLDGKDMGSGNWFKCVDRETGVVTPGPYFAIN